MESALIVRNLTVSRGYRTLFSQISFEAMRGCVLELRGANGAGKSSLLRVLAGLTRPDHGEVVMLDGEGGDAPFHLLGHRDGVKPQETVEEQVRFWVRFYGEDFAVIRHVLEQVNLWKRRDVPGRGLSAGQRRRLALARLLIAYRPIWLLDEPFASLDKDGQALVKDLVKSHCDKGGTVIAAMHGEGFDNALTFEIVPPQKKNVMDAPDVLDACL